MTCRLLKQEQDAPEFPALLVGRCAPGEQTSEGAGFYHIELTTALCTSGS